MSDTLGTTTFLTVVSTVTQTPRPVTITTTLTVLVHGTGTATESYVMDPTQSSPLPTPTLSTADVVTISVTLTPVPTGTGSTVFSTESVTRNEGLSKTTVIILAVLVPFITFLAVVAVWRGMKTRYTLPKSQKGKSSIPLQRWVPRLSRLRQTETKHANGLSSQMPDREGEVKAGLSSASPATLSPYALARTTPQGSPFRSVTGQPSRLSKPASLSGSIREVSRIGSPDSYSRDSVFERDDNQFDNNSMRATGTISQQSWPGHPLHEHLQTYDGTRRAFYETALNRNLPFDMLARPSLRLETPQETDPDRSLTPEPLRIVKKSDSAGTTITDLLNASRQSVRKAHTEPPNLWGYMRRERVGSLERALMEELGSVDDGLIDDETRRKQREDTLNYLEGVLPMSPPSSYRASSVYSRNEWGSPILGYEEEDTSAMEGPDAATSIDCRERKGKGKAVDVDQSGVEGK